MAYTATVTMDVPKSQRISRDLSLILGKCDITNYNQTGAEITGITKHFQSIQRVIVDGFSDNGYMVRWNATDKCFHAYYPTKAITPTGTISDGGDSVVLKDNDSAAVAGVPVYVAPDGLDGDYNYLAHLEFVSPTNAEGSGTISNGGASFKIKDDDGAAAGIPLYFDEDGANADSRLLAVLPDTKDCFVPLSDGAFLRIKHSASAAVNGVAVYFDEDAAASYNRLLFVSPTNADGAGATDDSLGWQLGGTFAGGAVAAQPGTEVANSTDVGEVNFIAIGLH